MTKLDRIVQVMIFCKLKSELLSVWRLLQTFPNVEVELVYPTEVGVPKWLLGDKGVFGAFTIYEHNYLHLFESRNNSLIENFVDLANDICSGQRADYRKYVIRASQDSHELYGAKILKEASFIKRVKKLIKG